VDIHLNHLNTVAGIDGATSMRMNYELDLSPSFNLLSANYAQNTRRNIRKASDQGLTLNRNIMVDELIDLFRENYGKKEGKLQESHYATLKQLINVAQERKLGNIQGVRTREGVLSAAAFFLFDQSHIYFLFAASAPEARENGAMFVLIDRFISDHAETERILDFEGGNDPNLGRFYKGFGSSEVPYPALRISRLSKVAEKGLYLIRNLRK
jgi:lipid II:glycine glycyltransferase (peptidoglycan interpeptide bridge formation enzyme)